MTDTTDLLALARKATQERWRVYHDKEPRDYFAVRFVGVRAESLQVALCGKPKNDAAEANAAYIAAANPAAIIALIERHRAERNGFEIVREQMAATIARHVEEKDALRAEVAEYERVKSFACKTIAEISPDQRADQGNVSYGIIGLITTLRAEVDALRADVTDMDAIAEELRAEVERLTRERDAWELTSRTSSTAARIYEDVARGREIDPSIILDATNRLNEVRKYAPPCVTRHEMEMALELIRDAMIASMTRAESAESALAAAQNRVGVLEELAREVAYDDGTRETVSEHNAFPFFSKLNQRMCMLRDKARAALAAPGDRVTNDQRGGERDAQG